ncbi:Protein dennd6a [Linnemannia zychae]|nr:Protein dennd6a [Linnemannia zychae]
MATNGSSYAATTTALNHPSGPESDLRSKHLSQPYNMQSISTESLPALFGAASLRRTNSNVSRTSRNNTSSSVPALTSKSHSTPSSPAHPLDSSTIPSNISGNGRASGHSSLSKKYQSGSTTGTASALGRPPIEMISEQFELEGSHDRRPSSWDIMDMLAIDQLRQWMVCFCVVNFDLEKGQGKCYSSHELTINCFSSFPDSNTFDVGDTVFNFRIRSTTAGRAATGPTTDAGFLYGYVFFRQKQDPSIRRGYFQKSVVILTQHPFIGLFSKIVSVLGPAYFEIGKPMLETAFHDIARWAPPTTDSLMELPFMGQLLQVQIAKPQQPQLLETSPFEIATYQPDTHILSSVPINGGLYKHFQDLVPDLWLCWELMTLAEPIMLIGTSPEVCSESVASLVDLINPIPYCGDYRPYFTIHDTDFKSFCNKLSPPSSIVLGVTNPFFAKTLEHWPHIIKIGKPMNRRPNGRLAMDGTVGKIAAGSPKFNKPSSLDFVQGLVSKRKGAIAKDTNLLCMLAEATANRSSPDYLLDNILRKHFVTLTEKFLVPLNRYFATLMPSDITLSSTSQFPHIAPFKQQNFLKFLAKNPPAITFKTSTFKSSSEACQSFYKDFLKCGNFATWLRLRTIAAQNELRKRYLEILSLGDVAKWVKGRNEVEVVDLLVRMREELGSSGNKGDLFSSKPKLRTRPILSREGSFNSGYGSDPSLMDAGGMWTGDLSYGFNRRGSASGSGSDAESRTITPPPLDSDQHRYSPSTPLPSNGDSQLSSSPYLSSTNQNSQTSTGSKATPIGQRLSRFHGDFYSNTSSYNNSANSSREGTPTRSSSSSSLNSGYPEYNGNGGSSRSRQEGNISRETSPERHRKRYAPEASIIKATVKQKEQLRDQIRILVEALPLDLRESLMASEAKKKSMAMMAHEGY